MGDDAYSSLSYCMDLERLGRDEASNAGVTPGASGFVSDHERWRLPVRFRTGRSTRWSVRLRVEAAVRGVPPVRHRRHRVRGRDRGRLHVGGRRDELGAPVYQCVVDDGFDAGSDVFGVDVLSALEDTLRRIRSARAGMGDFDEVAREVMGVEQFRPEMYDDDYGSVALDLGYVLPSLMASFEPRPAAASAPDGADPTLLADDSAASSRLV